MNSANSDSATTTGYLDQLRIRLAGRSALLQLSIFGAVAGLLVGILMLLFRGAVEGIQSLILPGGDPENFEGLPVDARFMLPLAGALLLGLIYLLVKPKRRQGGVVHVLERLAYHQGHMSTRNAWMEFIGSGIALISGQSVGREGPSVHLGAAGTSLLGRQLGLPNNTLRVLIGCGVAAAIGAAFNTPLAGVIFAMEVVLMEYTIAGFAPIILAAVSSTAVTHLVYGSSPAFNVPPILPVPLIELPILFIIGLMIGGLAALFSASSITLAARIRQWPLLLRFALAGLVTACLAIFVPAIMGVGYDTVNDAMTGELTLSLLLIIVLAKCVATVFAIGCNLPGGLIGPTLVIGAVVGAAIAAICSWLFPEYLWQPAVFALVGMAAMMAATLQAPLAALMALLELSGNTTLIFPGMLTVITAVLVSREVFHKDSIILELLRARGLDYRNDPVAQSLRRIGVAGVMEAAVQQAPASISVGDARRLLERSPKWLLLESNETRRYLLAAADLARYLAERDERRAKSDDTEDAQSEEKQVDLVKLPGRRIECLPVTLQANLQEALDLVTRQEAEGVYVQRRGGRLFGVLTRESIEQAYSR
ncbi:MAG: chloride channel protein [Gammaproteobacteria bacterium]|nr:chloride channel protein [Gammaproteobacteria bacterium]